MQLTYPRSGDRQASNAFNTAVYDNGTLCKGRDEVKT